MLAPARIPQHYQQWNRRWNAPYGNPWLRAVPVRFRRPGFIASHCGLFGFQPNNSTRAFEYPWVFEQLNIHGGMQLLEIGGGYSGLQFVLDRLGCEVTNVDPGIAARGCGWPVDADSMETLNRRFSTRVRLKNCFLDQAGIESNRYDRVYSVSVLEHVPRDDIRVILDEVYRILKPGGLFVLTLDLFLNIRPFTTTRCNRYGSNIPVRWLIENSGLTLIHGDPSQLYGFAGFDAAAIERNRQQFLVGRGYPAMVQTLVLRK